MKITRWGACITVSLALSVLLFGTGGAGEATSSATTSGRARITILYDAFGKRSDMEKDWGYAALIEYGGKRILFDTGDNPEILEKNAKAAKADLSHLDFVVLSHRHSDHMGGMDYLLRVNPKVKIYAPKENFGIYGSSLPGTFYRRDESLTPSERYYDGAAPAVMKFGSAWPRTHFELIESTQEIAPGIHIIALVSDKPGTLELRELSLALQTPEGIVLVVGCSHPGIEKILAETVAIDRHIHMVVGGFHLVTASDADIEKVVTSLHDTWNVDYLAPGHCTGEPTFTGLKKAFGERYLYAGLGSQIEMAQVRLVSRR
jgi:7,8-dihydropterin-6-yl-methyl-4-(beta-D-ribofuranosyl)aminobenzene 5'-phosphate synthase